MAGGRRLTLRPGHFHELGLHKKGSVLKPQFGHWAEYALDIINIVGNSLFVIGCVLFFDLMPSPFHHLGLWLFIVGSILGIFVCIIQLWESTRRRTLQGGEHSELPENIGYLVGQILYTIGCIYWLPTLYEKTQRSEFLGHAIGAWLFIIGSLSMVFASFCNAVGVEQEAARAFQTRPPSAWTARIARTALCCSTFAGCFFVAGSFLFRPGFENECMQHTPGRNIVWVPPSQDGVDHIPGAQLFQPAGEAALSADVVEAGDPKVSVAQENHGSRKWKRHNATRSAFLQPEPGIFRPRPAAGVMGVGVIGALAATKKELVEAKEMEAVVGEQLAATQVQVSRLVAGCVSTLEQGTWLFLSGSFCCLFQSVLSLTCTALMHRNNMEKNVRRAGAERFKDFPIITDDSRL
mmetsp:Transcript_16048/g.33978  ORF Transcript_16048/g.33978 Transcript_16048/m.33978 type:complete len:407 (-) Transcript_16048:33-1253(-)